MPVNLALATGQVEGGRLTVNERAQLAAQIRELRDGPVTITIERQIATRSKAQNDWYWSGIIDRIAEHTGYTPDEIHELCKAMFLPRRLAMQDDNGEIVGEYVIGGSTTRLNTAEFSEYCERIRAWAAGALGVDIPDPITEG